MEIGINAMSLIGEINKDFEGCVAKLKEGGCSYLEPVSDFGAKPETLAFYAKLSGGASGWDLNNFEKRLSYLRSVGLDVKGMFVFDEDLENQIDDIGKFCAKNQISYIVISFLEYKNGIDSIYEGIDMVHRIAKVLATYHVQIILHNHEHDLSIITDRDGQDKYIMDIFLEQCSPEELMLEADTGWLVYAGVDAADYVRQHINRISILHFKDISKDYKTIDRQDIFVSCGHGAVDFKAVLDAVPEKDKNRILYILDQDASKGDIVEDQIASLKYIQGLSK